MSKAKSLNVAVQYGQGQLGKKKGSLTSYTPLLTLKVTKKVLEFIVKVNNKNSERTHETWIKI